MSWKRIERAILKNPKGKRKKCCIAFSLFEFDIFPRLSFASKPLELQGDSARAQCGLLLTEK